MADEIPPLYQRHERVRFALETTKRRGASKQIIDALRVEDRRVVDLITEMNRLRKRKRHVRTE